MEREKVTISIDIVRDMIKEIDIRLIPELHDLDDYSEKEGIYRLNRHQFATPHNMRYTLYIITLYRKERQWKTTSIQGSCKS